MSELDKQGHQLLDLFEPLVLENLVASEIVVHIPELAGYLERITQMVNNGHPVDAAKILLINLKKCETGWFKQFMCALDKTEHHLLYKVFSSEDQSPHKLNHVINKQKILKRLIAVFFPDLIKIEPIDIATCLFSEKCLNDRDMQLIDAEKCQRGVYAAMTVLLSRVALRNEDWFIRFVNVLRENKHETLADQIALIESSEKIGKLDDIVEINQMDDGDIGVYEGHYSEEGMDVDVESSDQAIAQCSVSSDKLNNKDSSEQVQPKTLELRNYQEELAMPGIDGHNVLIQAPTGSGKTHVALKIAQEHFLTAAAPGEQRMIFFVPTVSLVDQQLRMFESYLGKLKCVGISGDSEISGKSLLVMYSNEYDVIVCTPQLFVDALKDKEFGEFSKFTLIIFDECHRCMKKNPYNAIMNAYLDKKLENEDLVLPQVVGLTASVGTGAACGVDQTMTHILRLCAHLDADCLQIVRQFKDELELYVNRPGEQSVSVKGRTCDPFFEEISALMEKIEERMHDKRRIEAVKEEVPNIEKLLCQPSNRGSERYTQWLSGLDKPLAFIHAQKTRRFFVACREYLKVFNDALIINADCRTKDAMEYLRLEIPEIKITCRDEADDWLESIYKDREKTLATISREEKNKNPKLDVLRARIMETFDKEPDSRAILFVKRRALALALVKWMEETPGLDRLKPDHLVGAAASADRGGMTGCQQTDVLKYFQGGVRKILVATSVAEEGLDIEKCNLVIRYLHVTSDIARVQTMGRSRAKDADYLVVAGDDGKTSHKEDENRMKEQMAARAIERIHRLKKEMFKQRVRVIQREEKIARDMEKLGSSRRRLVGEEEYQLRCFKCDTLACHSGDLRAIEEAHHVVIDDSFHVRISIAQHPNPKKYGENNNWFKVGKVHCKACQFDWGIQALYNEIMFCVLKISSFILVDARDRRSPCKKWKNAPFTVQAIDTEDMQIAAQSQT